VPIPQPIVRPPAEVRDTRRLTRLITEKSLELSNTTSELTAELTRTYQLNVMEQKKARRELRIMRIGHKAFVRNVRDHFGIKCRTEEARGLFLNWLEDECLAVQALDTATDEDD